VEELQAQARLLRERLSVAGGAPLHQCLRQVVQAPLDPLAEHEAVIAAELAGMTAGPNDQVIRLGDDDQFLVVLLYSYYRSI
jgi:hypothetical protein